MTGIFLPRTRWNIHILNAELHFYAHIGIISIIAPRSSTSKLAWTRWMHGLTICYLAYFPNRVNLDLSFGQTKKIFYELAHQGHFQYDTFDTLPEQVPLASVTVEFFLVRPIPQWRVYLAWHGVELYDLPLDMTVPQLSNFHAIGPNVQPRLDFGAFILCKIVNFLSSAHRNDTCITFLRNQLLFSSAFTTDHFRITPYDANLLLRHVFPADQYPVEQLTSNTGYLLLLRAFKWVHQPHSLASAFRSMLRSLGYSFSTLCSLAL